MMERLDQSFNSAMTLLGENFFKSRVSDTITSNLREGIEVRPYQREALGRFDYFFSEFKKDQALGPRQALFHMATGSGKTLIMAGLILYLYEKGYRNFLFFVNSTNILEKTRDNFLNSFSSKYLFGESIVINRCTVHLKEVQNFQATDPASINIVFTTIQGLHARLNTPRENSLTYDDFEGKNIVFLSDEAHHLNTETKKGEVLAFDELDLTASWESTVKRIFQSSPKNLLLEFTATADLGNPEILRKYSDKIVYDYPLREFRKDGYSKEVKVFQADLASDDRALLSVILSQYRKKVFEKYALTVKPVILFKSKTVKDSQRFVVEFLNMIKGLRPEILERLEESIDDGIIKKAFKFFRSNQISSDNLVLELKEDFSQDKVISVNSKDESEAKQIAVNTLEDEKNQYRVVFAVDKLNEGWDVLNLFDIVRLYDTRDSKAGKPGKTTMSEAQLIGRGARYFPFKVFDDQAVSRRKFDSDLNHELRVCEELYYHSAYNPKYIQELNVALEEIGIKAKEVRECALKVKDDFKETDVYKNGLLFLNELVNSGVGFAQ